MVNKSHDCNFQCSQAASHKSVEEPAGIPNYSEVMMVKISHFPVQSCFVLTMLQSTEAGHRQCAALSEETVISA